MVKLLLDDLYISDFISTTLEGEIMGYLLTLDEMVSKIDVGVKGRINGKEFIFISRINPSNQYRCDLLVDGIEKGYNFKTLYSKELIEEDNDIFRKGDNSELRDSVEKKNDDYFLRFNSILLTSATTEEEMKKVYFSGSLDKCIFCEENDKEPCWAKYDIACGNAKYYGMYHDKYNAVTKEFFTRVYEKSLKPLGKKLYTIVFVGCGNLYELEVLNEFLENKDFEVNVIVLDLGLWKQNQFNSIKDNLRIKNIWFKKCDFTIELQNEIYSTVDLIYYSRCIIPVNIKTKEKMDSILRGIINYRTRAVSVISQVLNVRSEYSVDFENNLRALLQEKYHVLYSFKTDKISIFWNSCDERICKHNVNGSTWEFTIVDDDMKKIPVDDDLLHFYMYAIKGDNIW